jgi:hypothetical protein
MDGGSFDASGFSSCHASSHDYSSHNFSSHQAPSSSIHHHHNHHHNSSGVGSSSGTAHGTASSSVQSVPAAVVEAAVAAAAVAASTEALASGSAPTTDCESGTPTRETCTELSSQDTRDDASVGEVPVPSASVAETPSRLPSPASSMAPRSPPLSARPRRRCAMNPFSRGSHPMVLWFLLALMAAILVFLLQSAVRRTASGDRVAGSAVAIAFCVIAMVFVARACRALANEAS